MDTAPLLTQLQHSDPQLSREQVWKEKNKVQLKSDESIGVSVTQELE